MDMQAVPGASEKLGTLVTMTVKAARGGNIAIKTSKPEINKNLSYQAYSRVGIYKGDMR